MKRRRAVGVTSPRVSRCPATLGCRRRCRRLPPRTAGPHRLPPPCPSPQAGSKDASKLDTLFNLYKDKSSEEDVIGPEGALGLLPCERSPACCVPRPPARSRQLAPGSPRMPRLSAPVPVGVEKLCKDLKVDPTDRQVLLLAHKVGGQGGWATLARARSTLAAGMCCCGNACCCVNAC